MLADIFRTLEDISQALNRQADAQERIAAALEAQKLAETGDQQAAAQLLGVSPRTISRYHAKWIEGVHYYHVGTRLSYNLQLLRDWKTNQGNKLAHQRAILKYQQQLASNQKRRRG